VSYTHTFAILTVSRHAWDEIKASLERHGYEHAFVDDDGGTLIDMHGVALKRCALTSIHVHGKLSKLPCSESRLDQ